MAMMEEKRVADYFVVCGLPDNPEPLEELSDENILKASHKQDPIVEVAVINRTLGESPPPKFRLIDQTPTNFPADLNHGSIRAPEIYLCYKRGREKPPITDIGVLYEGKQRVMPGCEVVYNTPYGRPANVNNTNSSRTYITFRRADTAAPSDTLAVTDICVILTNKGEVPPHAFCQIGKNLNKGMVGSDVYLCYKKSMVKANYVAFKPGLLSRYPDSDYDNFGLPETVSQFCLPLGAIIECWPTEAKHPRAVFSTFVLTGANGEKVYGSAVIFYEPLPESALTPALQMQLGLEEEEQKNKSMHVNKCIALLSRWPFFDTFKKFLSFLYRVPATGAHIVPIERYISHFMTEVPFPSPQRPRILVQFNQAAVSLAMPEETPLPHSGASFTMLLMSLGPEDTMNLLLYTLMEHKILIHSLRHAVLTSVAEAVANMIFPFHWQCPYIPLCPLGLSTVLNAPIPFVVGVDSRYFDLYDPPQDVTCVDLDTNTITPADDKKGVTFKWMPKRPIKVLRNTLEKLYTQVCLDMSGNGATATTAADNSIDCTDAEVEAIDLDFAKHRKELLMETAIQEALLRFMASLLKGYNNFLKPITQAPTSEATGLGSLFDTQGFLKSRDKAYHKFFTHLMKTQLFSRFIEERSFVSDKDASLAFFDECTDKVDENRDEPHLIELDDSSKSERTVFITPPDPVGLPPGIEYTYPSFPSQLRPELFLEKARPPPSSVHGLKVSANGAGGKNPAPPASPMTRRTKQEVKSAQKIAQKQVASPELWAKCLLGHCYSLWFTHLPSYVRCVHSKTKALRTAYDVLVRMQQAKLQQPDEVCYRVLLQLCGVYSQPVLAVKVLFQMRQHGLQPNAITYGFYNKAVLESKWPTSDTNAFLQWRKLQNVVTAVAQFKQGMKGNHHRRFSAYSNSESDYDRVSRASTDSYLDDVPQPLHDRVDAAVHSAAQTGAGTGAITGKKAEHIESPNIEERTSTGGLSDRGYSSMTSEDAKRMSLTIGSQESLESLGLGKIRPMFINRETIKENGPGEMEQSQASDTYTNNSNAVVNSVEMRTSADSGNDMRLSVSSVSSVATLRASTCSSAGLLMTTDTSLDENVFGGDHTYSKAGAAAAGEKQRHRHSSADGPGIFRPVNLGNAFSKEADITEDSKRTTLIGDSNGEEEECVEGNGESTTIVPVVTSENTDGADSSAVSDSTAVIDASSMEDNRKLQTHSTPHPSPSHSIRTPVVENDPLGLLGGSQADQKSNHTTSTTMPVTSLSAPLEHSDRDGELNRPLVTSVQSDDARSTNDSGIGDIGGGVGTAGSREKLQKELGMDEQKSSDCHSTTSSESSLSSPCSPGWKPVHTSVSDQLIIDSKGPTTPPPANKSRSATLPAGGIPKLSSSRGTSLSRNESITGVLHTAASGFMSRFRQLKDSMVTPTGTPVKGSQPSSATGASGSNTSLPKAHEMEKHLYEDEEQQQHQHQAAAAGAAAAHQETAGITGPAVEVTTFEERVPLGYKNRMKHQLQRTYSPFVSGLMQSPTMKNLQSNLAPTVKSLQSGFSTGWSTMKESLAETWNAEASFREQEQAYAAAALANTKQEMEKRALDSDNFGNYARNADLTDSGLRLAARRTYSLKNSSMAAAAAGSGFQPLDEMRPRATSLSSHADNAGGLGSGANSQDGLDAPAPSSLHGSVSSLQPAAMGASGMGGGGGGGLFNTAVEVEMCSLSRCATCQQLLYDEEIMAGWSADDSNLNTQCQFCQAKLVPFLQIYLKDYRHSSKPLMMTPSQSCESMQSVHSLPNVPMPRPPPANNRSLTSLNSTGETTASNGGDIKEETPTKTDSLNESTTPKQSPGSADQTMEETTSSPNKTLQESPGNAENESPAVAESELCTDTADDKKEAACDSEKNECDNGTNSQQENAQENGESETIGDTGDKKKPITCSVDTQNTDETKVSKVDIKIGGGGEEDSNPASKENSPERKRCSSETVAPSISSHRKHREGSSSMGDLLEENAAGNRDGRGLRGGVRSCVCLEPVTVPYLSPLVLRKELETVLDAEGDLCLSVSAFVDEHPILYWNLVWYFKRLGVHSHLPGFMLTARATNKEIPPKIWQKANSRHVHVRAVWDNPRLHEELATPMYMMWNQAAASSHLIHPLLKEHEIFSRGMMQQLISSIMENDVTAPIRTVLDERRRLQKVTSRLPQPPPHHYSIYRDILFLSFAVLGHENIDNDSFDKEYRGAFSYMNPRHVAQCKKQDKAPNYTIMYCRRTFDPLELVNHIDNVSH